MRSSEPCGRFERVCAGRVYVVMNAHLFIIYRSERERRGGREGERTGSVPAPSQCCRSLH